MLAPTTAPAKLIMRNVPEFPFAYASGWAIGRQDGDLVVVDGGRGVVAKVVVRAPCQQHLQLLVARSSMPTLIVGPQGATCDLVST